MGEQTDAVKQFRKDLKTKTPKQRHSGAGRKKRDIAKELSGIDIMRAELGMIEMQQNSKLTPEVVGKLKQAFSIDATVEEACHYAGIHKDTYYDWKKRWPQLSDELENLRLNPILAARQTIVTAAQTDTNVARWLLERKRRKEFATQLNLADSEGKNMPAPILNIFANIGQEPADDTKRDISENVIDGEVSQKSNKTLPEPVDTPSTNIMDDIS